MDPLERIMAGLASTDGADADAFVWSLWEHAGEAIGRALLSANRRIGLRRIDPDDLDGLVWDACEVIRSVAGGWRPDGGALPWVYARPRLEGLLRDHAGPPTRPWLDDFDDLDWDEARPPVPATDDPPAIVVLDELARRGEHPVLLLLQDALDQVARPEDHELVLLYAEQLSLRDRSPAHTVGALVDRRAANVRQVFCRVRRRLRRLAVDDGRFRPLLALPMLAEDDDGAGFERSEAAA